jgi:hypothetical protein
MRYLALLALAVVPFVSGCDDDTKATPQAIFDNAFLQGNNSTCKDVGPLFKVGDFGNPNAEPPVPSSAVKRGDAYGQGSADIDCVVSPAGTDEFNVAGTIALSGATGGLFKIDGKLKTQGDQNTNIHAIFSSKKSGNTYDDRTCTVTYEASYRGIAPGRVWGIITCPTATNSQAQTVCEATAEFRFENCGE